MHFFFRNLFDLLFIRATILRKQIIFTGKREKYLFEYHGFSLRYFATSLYCYLPMVVPGTGLMVCR